ncbi:WD40 repeat-like protein [Lactarius indigo]|nr:WD40 repeat-like protein [Lactarius indigo]
MRHRDGLWANGARAPAKLTALLLHSKVLQPHIPLNTSCKIYKIDNLTSWDTTQSTEMTDQDKYLHLKDIHVDFIEEHPTSDLELIFKDDAGVDHKSTKFKQGTTIHWNIDIYVRTQTGAALTIQQSLLDRGFAEISVKFKPDEFGDDKTVRLEDTDRRVTANLVCGASKSLMDVTRVLGSQAYTAHASKVNMLDGLDKIRGFLKLPQLTEAAQLNTIALVAVSTVEQAIVNFQGISSCHQELVVLMDDLVSVLPIIHSALETVEVADCRALARSFIEEFVKETSEQLNDYASEPAWTFILENWYNFKRGELDELREKSTRLKHNDGLAIGVDIKELPLLEDLDQELKRIKPPAGSSFDPDPKYCCMPGTRVDLIETLTSFAVSEDASRRLFFLSGIAGCGKSSVATSVANSLHLRGRLTGSFFFKRVKELSDPANFLHTMAYFIASRHEPYKKILMNVLKTITWLEDQTLSGQFNALFLRPLNMIRNTSSTTASHSPSNQAIVAIVVDALNECDDALSVSTYLAKIVGLAPWLRVIVTSRPLDNDNVKQDLRRAQFTTHLDLFTIDAGEDILKFTQSSFAPLGPLHQLHSQVTEAEIEALAKKSVGVFIWIKIALLYIASLSRDAAKVNELKSIVSSSAATSPEKGVDELYLRVLRNVAGNSLDSQDAVKRFIGSIYVTSRYQSPPWKALHAFVPTSDPDIPVTPEDVDDLRNKLSAVITVDPKTEALRVCHPSFLDFVETQARSQEFWTKPSALDTMMAQRCFDIMKTGLKFNICGLESSRRRHDEIPDLKQRIPQELRYSAVYWLDHLFRSDGSHDAKLKDARDFLYHERLFYWLEVLSIISEVNAAAQTLRKLVTAARSQRSSSEFYGAFQSILDCVLLLHEPMTVSVPHIYISSVIWGEPWSAAIKLLPSGLLPIRFGTHLVDALNSGREVLSVAYSPDGRRIVTGSMHCTVQIWDFHIGIPLTKPLKGHMGMVTSVVFSPDGTSVVSGSDDGTVRIWDSQTGVPIREPLKGHTGLVTSVAYSPDGAHVISGSTDMTVRMWNAQTGALVRKPLLGPTGPITSVAYSPDGRRIICGSEDTLVWMWESLTGGLVGNPFEGHKGPVLSVTFSPDGKNIVSGSKDNTVRIWDPETGSLTCEPLRGHTNQVTSVAYSQDGKIIVSGSMDGTLWLWDPQTGKPIKDPLPGQIPPITSVTFSPDGRYIISGSFGNTVYVWDSQAGKPKGKLLRGHTNNITALAYSRDGKHIISGSYDKTIWRWDSKTGLPIGQPLRGHTDNIQSIVYSPDDSYIISASLDNTLQIWDSQTGAPIGEPLKGHKYAVLSVACSPDGTQIASGSLDSTVLIWDLKTCALIKGPLRGHTGQVSSVAYSSDGTLVVSGSSDGTIIIWDPKTSSATQEPLKGHTEPVSAIACSPTRSHVVSGSYDNTIQIWDLQTGKPIYEPLKGHTGGIIALGYSPDGNHIISVGGDTIRIWDSLTGALIGTPIKGHRTAIQAIAYSPDGRHIAVGAMDDTGAIRVWDTQTTIFVNEPSKNLSNFVQSVVYSQDVEYFWDPHQKDFMSRAKVAYLRQGANNNPDQDVEVAHLSQPLAIPSDGWLRTVDGGLLTHVPHEYRRGICDTTVMCIPCDVYNHPIRLDWNGVHNAWDDIRKVM